MAATETKRVVLLAREGKARDRLRLTLAQIGAELVLEADPNAVDAVAVQAVQPQVLLIALDPAIEVALDKLEPAINGGDYVVIFDDAELAAQRDGWDAQRWSRHLAAKLHGHADVLPPGGEDSDGVPVPEGRVASMAHFGVPPPAASVTEEETIFEFGTLALDDDAACGIAAPASDATSAVDFVHFDFGEIVPDQPVAAATDDFTLRDYAAAAVPPATEEASAPAPQVEKFDFADLSLASDDDVLPVPVPKLETETLAETFDLSGLSLEAIDVPVDEEPESRLIFGEESLQSPVTPDMPPRPLPPPESPALLGDQQAPPAAVGAPGAVLLFAGMGGPDAVRRVLAELPRSFPRPVLVQQHLDGGSYANLVRQLERVAKMPVAMAEAGQAPNAGTVYVVPNDVAVEFRFGAVGFAAGESDFAALLPALPPHDSAVLLLSGANKALVEPAYTLAAKGAFVAGQSAQNCYDPAAANALVEHGCESAPPNELAAKLAALW